MNFSFTYLVAALSVLDAYFANAQQSWDLNVQSSATPQFNTWQGNIGPRQNGNQQQPKRQQNFQNTNSHYYENVKIEPNRVEYAPSNLQQRRPTSNNLPAQVLPTEKPLAGNGLGSRFSFDVNTPQTSAGPAGGEKPKTALGEAQEAESKISTKLLATIAGRLPEDTNVVISPFSIWAVALVLLEAADGQSAAELVSFLDMQKNPKAASAVYSMLANAVVSGNSQGGFSSRNFIVRDQKIQTSAEFSKHLKDDFQAKDFPINLKNAAQNAQTINNWVSKVSNGRIKNLLKVDDFTDLKVLLGNIAYFKGRWRHPFNVSTTFTDQFKDTKEVLLGSVRMMVDKQVLSYGYSPQFESQMVEIPYADGKTSMVVMLPKRNVPLQNVLNKMSGLGLADIIPEMSDDEVELYLPKFKTTLDLTLNVIFTQLGVQDIFNEGSASLPGLSNMAFVTKINHLAEIDNNEEGSTASAASSAHVSYKTSSVTFHANRPFIYFINEIQTRAILFAGTFTNPSVI